MSGIDIESSDDTAKADTVELDSVTITDVNRYGIVNASNSCNNLKITNCTIENFDAPDANVYNTNLIYNGTMTIYVETCNIDNSYIELRNQSQLVKFVDVNINSTAIESTEGTVR